MSKNHSSAVPLRPQQPHSSVAIPYLHPAHRPLHYYPSWIIPRAWISRISLLSSGRFRRRIIWKGSKISRLRILLVWSSSQRRSNQFEWESIKAADGSRLKRRQSTPRCQWICWIPESRYPLNAPCPQRIARQMCLSCLPKMTANTDIKQFKVRKLPHPVSLKATDH